MTGVSGVETYKLTATAGKTTKDSTKQTTTAAATGTERTAETATMNSTSNKTVEELEKEIKSLESEKGLNYKKMQKIEAEIQNVIQQIIANTKEAKELQEKAIQENQEAAEKAISDNLAAYVEANKEGGKGMSREELEANISSSMPNSPNLAKALAKFVTASREMSEVDSLLGSLNSVIIDTNVIEQDIKTKTEAKTQAEQAAAQAAQQAAAAAAAQNKGSCGDPIGFVKDGARYDFIVDDGSFDSTSDFLGINNQWADMEALDKDGDKVINASELKEANIKMVKTVNGKKEVVDIADEFGEDFKVDLTSYKQGGSYEGIDTTKDTDNDGTVDQQLLGTYTIHIGDKDITGYNTLDDMDYLASEYGIKQGSTKAQTATAATDASKYSDELKQHSNFFTEYTQMAKELSENLDKGLVAFGASEATIKAIKDHAKSEGAKDANAFMEKMKTEAEAEQKAEDEAKQKAEDEAKAKQKAEENKNSQQTNANNQNNATQEATNKYQQELNKFAEAYKSNQNVQEASQSLKDAAQAVGKSYEDVIADLKALGVNIE